MRPRIAGAQFHLKNNFKKRNIKGKLSLSISLDFKLIKNVRTLKVGDNQEEKMGG